MSTRETEIKLRIADLKDARERIQRVNAFVDRPRHLEDNLLFDSPDRALTESGLLLRLRLVESKGILTYKGKGKITDGVKDREEHECDTDSPEQMQIILQRLGYSVRFRYQKYRTYHKVPEFTVHLCLDETPIGLFFEVEGEPAQIHECATRMGYSRDDYITSSYGTLYLDWCRENQKEPGHMIFS